MTAMGRVEHTRLLDTRYLDLDSSSEEEAELLPILEHA